MNVEDQARALEGRRRGLSYAAIAAGLKVPEDEVREVVAEALRGQERPETDKEIIKLLDLSRFDRIIQGLWTDASTGNAAAIDRMLRVIDARNRVLGGNGSTVMVAAFDAAVGNLALSKADGALVAAGRRLAERIDAASASIDPEAETKAMYLTPHLMNVLRELGATPAARASVKNAKEETGGKLANLRSIRSQQTPASA